MNQTVEKNGATYHFDEKNKILFCKGYWDITHLKQLSGQIASHKLSFKNITVDGSELAQLDSAGALFLSQLVTHPSFQNFSVEKTKLLALVTKQHVSQKSLPTLSKHNSLYMLGKKAANAMANSINFLTFLGEFIIVFIKAMRSPTKLRWREIGGTIEAGGYTALPIIGLLSFLIGVVLTYQMGIQLQNYGANIFIVNFLGIAILREFGPLLTAIIIAGRTGSAFTAQLGMMQINEEIDALRTMGISPVELLVLPRILGLAIALPLLSVWADVFGILGGMFMAKGMLGINFYDFLSRFQDVIQVKTYSIGLIKTPVFAFIIASIGCYQGMQVSGGAESVGRLTTKSVVQAIFFIIVVDAAFSILFSWLGI